MHRLRLAGSLAALIFAAAAHAQPATQPVPLPAAVSGASPGLVGIYVGGKPEYPADDATPFLVRTDPQVNFRGGDGEFAGSKLGNDFGVRWGGILRIATPGDYAFQLTSDDGSRLILGGTTVVDHGGFHPAEDKSATVPLSAGDYPIRVEYFQGGGGATAVVQWKPPGAKEFSPVPADVLFHAPNQPPSPAWDPAAWAATRFDRRDYQLKHGPQYARMDYGPSLAATYDLGNGDYALKGQAVRLNPTASTNIVFDTELLRYAAGWTDGFLKFDGVAYSGAHGPSPSPEGDRIFRTRNVPGFFHSGANADPRPKPFGPLPLEWGRYGGLYRSGEKTVLSYRIGQTDVLDLPEAVAADGKLVFLRTLKLAVSPEPLALVLCNADEKLSISISGPSQVPMETRDGLTVATFPARTQPAIYRVEIGRDKPDARPALSPLPTTEAFAALLTGGERLWTEAITTQGKLGTGDGAYVVDTVTVPFKNPWNASMRFGGFDFFADGSAAVCTWNGDVWIVRGIDDTLENVTWTRYATGLFQALGLKIVKDQVYVLGRDQISRLHDLNADGEADFYENFNNDCQVTSSFHEFALDLQTDPEGNFYYAKGGPVQPGGRGWEVLSDHNGTALKVSPDGKKLEVFATGIRAPNGMGAGPNGEITVADNEGTWTPACRINLLSPGLFVGVPDLSKRPEPPTTYDPPLCWLPHRDVDNSSGGQVWVSGGRWGPLEGEILHMSYGTCSLFKVVKEQVEGVWQGGVVRFPLGFDSGIMRARFHPLDGQLYVAGLRGWQTNAAQDACLQRVRYTGKPINMPVGLEARENGLVIRFSDPIDPETSADPDSYSVERWNYRWTEDYGSSEWSIANPDKTGRDEVHIDSATVLPDGKSVFLAIPDIAPCMQMSTRLQVDAADGTPMDFTISHTIHHLGEKVESTETSQ